MDATLMPETSLSGLGERTMSLRDLSGKILVHFAIKEGKPVMYIPSVIGDRELATITYHWKQYCEAHQGHIGH